MLKRIRINLSNKVILKKFLWQTSVIYLIAALALLVGRIIGNVPDEIIWSITVLLFVVIPVATYLDVTWEYYRDEYWAKINEFQETFESNGLKIITITF